MLYAEAVSFLQQVNVTKSEKNGNYKQWEMGLPGADSNLRQKFRKA